MLLLIATVTSCSKEGNLPIEEATTSVTKANSQNYPQCVHGKPGGECGICGFSPNIMPVNKSVSTQGTSFYITSNRTNTFKLHGVPESWIQVSMEGNRALITVSRNAGASRRASVAFELDDKYDSCYIYQDGYSKPDTLCPICGSLNCTSCYIICEVEGCNSNYHIHPAPGYSY